MNLADVEAWADRAMSDAKADHTDVDPPPSNPLSLDGYSDAFRRILLQFV